MKGRFNWPANDDESASPREVWFQPLHGPG